ncbi:MAG: tetratricopeptide repeat protein [Nitrospirota bacterium]
MGSSFLERNRGGIIALLILAAVVAFVDYWRTSELVPGDYDVRKGNYRLEDGQMDDAIEEFSSALKENPRHKGALLGLAVTYMQKGENEKALENFDRLIELDPENAVAYADRGILQDRMGRYSEALADYRRAMELNPRIAEGPGWLWRFMRNIDEKPPTIADRAKYIEEELKKPPEERLLSVPEVDQEQRMYKK